MTATTCPSFTIAGAADRKTVRDRLDIHKAQVAARHAEEERRLAYVAFTRARSQLFCSGYVWSDTNHQAAPAVGVPRRGRAAGRASTAGPMTRPTAPSTR